MLAGEPLVATLLQATAPGAPRCPAGVARRGGARHHRAAVLRTAPPAYGRRRGRLPTAPPLCGHSQLPGALLLLTSPLPFSSSQLSPWKLAYDHVYR